MYRDEGSDTLFYQSILMVFKRFNFRKKSFLDFYNKLWWLELWLVRYEPISMSQILDRCSWPETFVDHQTILGGRTAPSKNICGILYFEIT